jgi:hypothetical protein
MWKFFIGRRLEGNKEVEGAFNHSIVEEPVISTIIMGFRPILGTTDIEDVC